MSKIIPAHDPWGYILNDAMNHTSVTFLNELTGRSAGAFSRVIIPRLGGVLIMVCSYAVWGAGVMRSPLECTLQHGPGWVAR